MAKIINKWTVGITVAAVLGFAAWSYFQPEPQTSYITETGEVAVEGVDDSIFLLFFSPFSIPLANTRAASISAKGITSVVPFFHVHS